jgi:GAF domain-containing protein
MLAPHQTSLPTIIRVGSIGHWISEKLSAPSAAITEVGERRRARLLAWLTLAFFFFSIIGVLAAYSARQADGGPITAVYVLLGLDVLLSLIYVLSRSKYYAIGAVFFVAAMTAATLGELVTGAAKSPMDTIFSFLPLTFVLGSALLSLPYMAVVVAVNIIGIGFFVPPMGAEIRISLILGILTLIVMAFRDRVEKDRLLELETVNTELLGLKDELEQRVSDRVGELTLAGDVGRALSRERDFEILLQEAVELIRERFSLYYVRIYLVDEGGQNLILRAGTGKAGRELRRIAHRLPISGTSINSLAVLRKKAIIVEDTENSDKFRPNPLLPETRSEMAVPLLVGERVVGVLDLLSNRPGEMSRERLIVFDALAGQLAVAIDNAALLTQAQEARKALASQARRLSGEGWREFLDAIERSERLGFVLEGDDIQPLNSSIAPEDETRVLAATIEIADEPIGAIRLERAESGDGWSEADAEIVSLVSRQVADRIEGLRLLAQAERYRQESEEAARRLTREGWQDFMAEGRNFDLGYVYDNNRVLPLRSADEDGRGHGFSQPLQVRDEVIGELVLEDAQELDEESLALVRTVAERLSAHLENLRLTAQTQAALSETETLYDIIAEMNAAGNYDDVLGAIVERTWINRAATTMLCIFDRPLGAERLPEWIFPVAHRSTEITEFAAQYPTNAFEANPGALFNQTPVMLEKLETDARLDRVARTLFRDVFKAQSAVFVPLILAEQVIGFLAAFFREQAEIPEPEVQRLMAVAGQAAITVQSRLLLEQAQSRARQEERIRAVTAEVFSATDVDSIMRRAVEQVGQILGKPAYIYLGQEPRDGQGR